VHGKSLEQAVAAKHTADYDALLGKSIFAPDVWGQSELSVQRSITVPNFQS
jgi:hypothetical protein